MQEKAIIYNRVSTTEQNPELQLKACQDFCKSKVWDIVDVLQEQQSAYKEDSKREKFQELLSRAEKGEFQHIVVWNFDRFSRQEPTEVLKLVKKLSLVYGVSVNAVKGDNFSELCESIAKLKGLGVIGEALTEFLEKVLRGLEFQRAYTESKNKSDRVKLAVRKEMGITLSYKGNKWGRKPLSPSIIRDVLILHSQGSKIREIAEQLYYYDKNNNKKQLSIAVVHKIIKANSKDKSIVNPTHTNQPICEKRY